MCLEFSFSARPGNKEPCIVVGCASFAVRSTQSQFSSHTDFNVLIAVAISVFCITICAEVLSDPDSNVVKERPARGKSDLEAHDNPEAVAQWQETGTDDATQSRGMVSAHNCLDES